MGIKSELITANEYKSMEVEIVKFEVARNKALDDYFDARPHITRNLDSELLVEAGFRMAWKLFNGEIK